jgi:hypothetical protein
MAITPTLRFALKQYGSGGDPHPNRAEFNAMIDSIENNAAMFSQGATNARPPAGKRGRFFYDETVDRIFYDNGTAWKDANPNGGGGAGAALAIGGAGSEGTSSRAARADHTHPLPLATGAAPGAMSAADKAKLDGATDAATANALARRDANGRLSVNTPTAAAHAATKGYTDGLITDTAAYAEDLADAIMIVCTSTTRPAHILNRKIFETDTKRTLRSDGTKWEVWHRPFTAYTPSFDDKWGNLGAGNIKGGEYSVIAPGLVRGGAWVTVGADPSAMGDYFPSVSLPFTSASYGLQAVDGFYVRGGGGGPMIQLRGAIGGSASGFQVYSWPQPNTFMRTPKQDGLTIGAGDLIHFSFTYRADIPA